MIKKQFNYEIRKFLENKVFENPTCLTLLLRVIIVVDNIRVPKLVIKIYNNSW